jgi:hypothetical protein
MWPGFVVQLRRGKRIFYCGLFLALNYRDFGGGQAGVDFLMIVVI